MTTLSEFREATKDLNGDLVLRAMLTTSEVLGVHTTVWTVDEEPKEPVDPDYAGGDVVFRRTSPGRDED